MRSIRAAGRGRPLGRLTPAWSARDGASGPSHRSCRGPRGVRHPFRRRSRGRVGQSEDGDHTGSPRPRCSGRRRHLGAPAPAWTQHDHRYRQEARHRGLQPQRSSCSVPTRRGDQHVDLRRGLPLGGGRVTLVTASNCSNNSIAIYRVVPRTRKLVDVRARVIGAGMRVYGVCMYRSPRPVRYFVFVTSESGEVRQWRLFRRGRRVDARLVRTFQVGSQSEGCVADDALRRLYISEENVGIWRYGAEPGAGRGAPSSTRQEEAGTWSPTSRDSPLRGGAAAAAFSRRRVRGTTRSSSTSGVATPS
jgi:hypothetical protein